MIHRERRSMIKKKYKDLLTLGGILWIDVTVLV